MQKTRSSWLFLAGSLWCSALAHAGATNKPRIHWLQFDFPPYYLKDSVDGRDEAVALLLERYLPEFEFRRERIPASRLMKSLAAANDTNVCVLSLYRTPEREQNLLFSQHPSTFGLPIELVTRRELIDQLAPIEQQGRYPLAAVIEQHPKAVGITASRSFGATLDGLLVDGRITRLAGETALSSLMGMVARGRLDYTLGYPDEVVYLARNQRLANLVSVPLIETANFSLGYVGCNVTADNQAFLAALDTQWKAIYNNVNYLAFLQRWLQTDAKLRVERVFYQYRRQHQLAEDLSQEKTESIK